MESLSHDGYVGHRSLKRLGDDDGRPHGGNNPFLGLDPHATGCTTAKMHFDTDLVSIRLACSVVSVMPV